MAKPAAGRTPLMAAAYAGNVRILTRLLALGADPSLADQRGVTALMEAASRGYPQAVRVLLASGVDVGAKDAAGQTAADRAKRNGFGQIVALLEAAAPAKKKARRGAMAKSPRRVVTLPLPAEMPPNPPKKRKLNNHLRETMHYPHFGHLRNLHGRAGAAGQAEGRPGHRLRSERLSADEHPVGGGWD